MGARKKEDETALELLDEEMRVNEVEREPMTLDIARKAQ